MISLQGILEGFNAPVNEEQAWALFYQCADFLQQQWERSHCFTFSGLNSVKLSKDGLVSEILPNSGVYVLIILLVESLIILFGLNSVNILRLYFLFTFIIRL